MHSPTEIWASPAPCSSGSVGAPKTAHLQGEKWVLYFCLWLSCFLKCVVPCSLLMHRPVRKLLSRSHVPTPAVGPCLLPSQTAVAPAGLQLSWHPMGRVDGGSNAGRVVSCVVGLSFDHFSNGLQHLLSLSWIFIVLLFFWSWFLPRFRSVFVIPHWWVTVFSTMSLQGQRLLRQWEVLHSHTVYVHISVTATAVSQAFL